MRMNAVIMSQRVGVLGAVLGGIVTYVIHIYSREGTEEDKKVGALNRNIVRWVMQLPKNVTCTYGHHNNSARTDTP